MELSTIKSKQTFGDWAYLAIAKHYRKMCKHEEAVLADRDPEELHQMRVGMRRLRSAISGFTLALPSSLVSTEKKIGRFAKVLGNLRDLDVLIENLTTQYYPHLPVAEQQVLERVLQTLSKRRKYTFKKVEATLHKSKYRQLKKEFKIWLKQPHYQTLARLPLDYVLADLLLPQISKFLLHPGWLVGINLTGEPLQIASNQSQEEVGKILDEKGEYLHELRKEAKRSRYNLDLFTQFYDDNYRQYIQDIKAIQEVLGEIQDSFVLAELLTDILSENLDEVAPNLTQILARDRYQKWQAWQALQSKFIEPQFRYELHHIIYKSAPLKLQLTNQNNLGSRAKLIG